MSIESASIDIQPMPKQALFMRSDRKFSMFSGGMGSGKSRALCYALARHATVPGNVILLLRKTLVWLKKSTLPILIGEPDSVLPPGSYQWNKSDGTIRMINGAIIHVLGLEDPERIRSINAGAAFIDEAAELTEQDFREVTLRLRHPLGTRQLFCVTNPSGPSHHLYKFFFLSDASNRMVVTASSLENAFLPKDYVEEALGSLEGSRRRRLLEGQWCQVEGSVFDTFSRDVHVARPPSGLDLEEYVVGIDYGYTNPTAMITVGSAGSRLFAVEEWVRRKCLLKDIVEEAERLRDRYRCVFVYDPSAAALGGELANRGLEAFPANNDVAGGIDRIRNRLRVRGDSPDLLISDLCPTLISEMETYAYQPETEKPVKADDHGCDALRYVINRIDDLRAEGPRMPMTLTYGDGDLDDFKD